MSDAFWLALITAIPTTLAALGAMYVSIRNGHKADITAAKVDAVDAKAIEIHTLTNSQLSRVTAALELANSKIAGLERLVSNMAEAKAIADQVIVNATPKPPPL